jgi:tetratricopeptide (TPR) repeat protein
MIQVIRRSIRYATILLAAGLTACGGVHVYDEEKAQLSGAAQAEYHENQSLAPLLDAQEQALDRQLERDLAAVRTSHQIELKSKLLRIAEGLGEDDKVARFWDQVMQPRLMDPALGIYSDEVGDLVEAIGQYREYYALKRFLQSDKENFRAFSGGLNPPVCRADSPPPETLSPEMVMGEPRMVQRVYKKYWENCNKLLEAEISNRFTDQLQQAALELEQLEYDEYLQSAQLEAAAQEYDQAMEDLARAGGTEAEIRGVAQRFSNAIERIAAVDAAGPLAQRQAIALRVMLMSAANGPIETGMDPKLDKASILVGTMPSMVGHLANIKARAEMPSVGKMLMGMRHQENLIAYADLRKDQLKQRVELLEQGSRAVLRELEGWRDFHNSLCNLFFAMSTNITRGVGDGCAGFGLTQDAACTYDNGQQTFRVDNCPIAGNWRDLFEMSEGHGDAKRFLYEALTGLIRAWNQQTIQDEIEVRLIDQQHRGAFAANRSAIEMWDNLIGVPIDRIAAYYQAGIKPAEIFDLLVKAYGMSAIAAGAAQ